MSIERCATGDSDTCFGVQIGTLFAQLLESRRVERCLLERMFNFVELSQRKRIHRSRQLMLLRIQVEVLPAKESTEFGLDFSRLIQPIEYCAHKLVQHLVQRLEERPETAASQRRYDSDTGCLSL